MRRPVLPVALLCLSHAAARQVVSFDFGWKHRAGLHAADPPDAEPPVAPDPGPSPAEAQATYSDADWQDVQLPHDGLIASAPSKAACPTGCSGKSYIPRHVLWYRKSFTLPAEWRGSAVWLDFEGSFRSTTVWVNGEAAAYHDCGYTPFRLRLDNITNVKFGGANVIAVFVDPDNGDLGGREQGSGWWYEGGGLYRHVKLVKASPVHVAQDGFFASSNLTASLDGGPSANMRAAAEVTNTGGAAAQVCVRFRLVAPDGSQAAMATSGLVDVPKGGSATAVASFSAGPVQLWTSSQPIVYAVHASVHLGQCSGSPVDSVEQPHGFRSLRYDVNDGFFLNDQHFKVRGFCDHNTFAVVGMAVPQRVNLFRAQASRAVGGNGRRTSHNPPETSMLDIYDRLGIVVMDENRLFANETRYVTNMGAMVKRDRNHPSVVIWSFCNEGGCEGEHEAGGPRFSEIANSLDGTRPTLANMFTFNDLLSNTVDVQGFSHQSRAKLEKCHDEMPHKPIFGSECCSCNTMRDEDEGCETTYENPQNGCTQKSFNARCTESNSSTNASDGVDWVVGTMVWTLFDYYGEPPEPGFEVSSTYGQFDLCGFPKAAAFWYRTQWLLTIPDGPDKTFPTHGAHEVFLVESWESPDSFNETRGNKTRSIHAYTSAPSVELFVNAKSQGARSVVPMAKGPGSYAEWLEVPWEAGSLVAKALDGEGAVVATAARRTLKGPATALLLTIDAPSHLTGTGGALLLDGQDAALLRASVVDAGGAVMRGASHNVSFRVVSGPGRVQGTHNGDPHCYEPNDAPWHSAYHGLVRAVVRVTSVAGRPAAERELLSRIDTGGPMADPRAQPRVEPIVVEASSPGFRPVTVSIPVSLDAAESGVMAVASAAAGKSVDFFAHLRGEEPTASVQFV